MRGACYCAHSLPGYKLREGPREEAIIVLRTHSLITRTGYSRTPGYTLQNQRPQGNRSTPFLCPGPFWMPTPQTLSLIMSAYPSGEARVTGWSAGLRVCWEEPSCSQSSALGLVFQAHTHSCILEQVPDTRLCWLSRYFPFIAVMRFNIFPEITSESVLGYGTRVTLACRERDFSKHACTHVHVSHTSVPWGMG